MEWGTAGLPRQQQSMQAENRKQSKRLDSAARDGWTNEADCDGRVWARLDQRAAVDASAGKRVSIDVPYIIPRADRGRSVLSKHSKSYGEYRLTGSPYQPQGMAHGPRPTLARLFNGFSVWTEEGGSRRMIRLCAQGVSILLCGRAATLRCILPWLNIFKDAVDLIP